MLRTESSFSLSGAYWTFCRLGSIHMNLHLWQPLDGTVVFRKMS
jgi:hypothetical protein